MGFHERVIIVVQNIISQKEFALWHANRTKFSFPVSNILDRFLGLIPASLDPSEKQNEEDFTRNRKLPFPKLMVFILHLVGAGRTEGVDIEAGRFFKNARRSGLWDGAQAVHRSALTQARKKVRWTVFRDLLQKAVALAYDLMPLREGNIFHGMPVLAIDGSKFTLPATEELRAEFDPHSGLQYPSKGHYPQCLVSTLYDVFRRIPMARTIMPYGTSERQEAIELLPYAPKNSLVIFDRGYPSYGLLLYLTSEFAGHFLMRSPATSTFPAVEAFLKSGKAEDIIWIQPTYEYRKSVGAQKAAELKPLQVRAIRMIDPAGQVSVLLTDLLDRNAHGCEELVALYFRRWNVEVYYRDEKIVLDVEKFHGKSPNSIRQELFAAMIVTVIARMMAAIAHEAADMGEKRCQMKNAVITLAVEAAILAPENPAVALKIFEEILHEIARVKYYVPRKPRPPQPRVTKSNINKWRIGRAPKLTGP
jgi:hypothetical protein